MFDKLLSNIAPHSCCGCGNVGDLLCAQCKFDIIYEPFGRCVSCLVPVPEMNLCAACRAKTRWSGGWVVGARDGALRGLLDRYKFHSAREATDVLAGLLLEVLPVMHDITVVPVPTPPAHRRVRGFDHTALIAQRLARQRHLPCSSVLVRESSEVQHFKSRQERYESAEKGLRITRSVPRSVLLVDDIYTTGATVGACAKLLRENGAEEVFVALIARQVLDE